MIFSSCKSSSKQETQDSAVIKSVETPDQSLILLQKFKPIINGVWVKSDYIDKINKTKSPLAAADLAVGITTMAINTDLTKGDSLVVLAGYGNHEGGNAIIKFKSGKTSSTIIFNGEDLGYSIENGDTVLLVYEKIGDNKKPELVRYIKAPITGKPDELGSGLYELVNKALVAGDYTFADSTGKVSKVNFSMNGKTSGLQDFKTYAIDVDLNNGPMENLDGIGFDVYTKKHVDYTYKIIGDTLNLYSTRVNADSTEDILDKLKYKLIRSK